MKMQIWLILSTLPTKSQEWLKTITLKMTHNSKFAGVDYDISTNEEATIIGIKKNNDMRITGTS